jgi:hypothetical protein
VPLIPTLTLVLIAFGLTAAAADRRSPDAVTAAGGSIAVQNVSVVSMTSARPLRPTNVLIRRGRIISLDANLAEVRAAAVRVDGAGKYLVPGFTDAQVHLPTSRPLLQAVCDLLIANGVTAVFDLAGTSAQLRFRDDIQHGKARGPRIYVSGPPVGDPHGGSTVTTPDDIEGAVMAQKREGYDMVKLRGDLSREAYRKLNSVARKNSIRLVGHAPRNLGSQPMFEERQDAVAHVEEYLYAYYYFQRDINAPLTDVDLLTRSLAGRTATAGTVVISTLAVFRGIPEQISDLQQVLSRVEVQYMPSALGTLWNWWAPRNTYTGRFRRDMIPWFELQYRIMTGLTSAFHRAGVRLLAGTDTPTPAMVPGFSIHDELQELVTAGLSPYEALKTATVNPAAFVRTSSEAGTIEVGKRADMVLLAGNPLENISKTRQIEGVFLNGKWYSKQTLKQLMRARLSENSTAIFPICGQSEDTHRSDILNQICNFGTSHR